MIDIYGFIHSDCTVFHDKQGTNQYYVSWLNLKT